jgi:hypothetical protein
MKSIQKIQKDHPNAQGDIRFVHLKRLLNWSATSALTSTDENSAQVPICKETIVTDDLTSNHGSYDNPNNEPNNEANNIYENLNNEPNNEANNMPNNKPNDKLNNKPDNEPNNNHSFLKDEDQESDSDDVPLATSGKVGSGRHHTDESNDSKLNVPPIQQGNDDLHAYGQVKIACAILS